MEPFTNKLLHDFCMNLGMDMNNKVIRGYDMDSVEQWVVKINYFDKVGLLEKEDLKEYPRGHVYTDILKLMSFVYKQGSGSKVVDLISIEDGIEKEVNSLMSYFLFGDDKDLPEKNRKMLLTLDKYISDGRIDIIKELLSDPLFRNLHPSLLKSALLMTESIKDIQDISIVRFQIEHCLNKALKKDEIKEKENVGGVDDKYDIEMRGNGKEINDSQYEKIQSYVKEIEISTGLKIIMSNFHVVCESGNYR